MIFLLDTNAFSDLMRDHPVALAHLSTHAKNDRTIICPIVRGEVLYGIERLPLGRKRSDLQAKANTLFSQIPCEPLPEAAGEHYASAKIAGQQKSLSLDDNDLWLAGMALALNAALVTRDKDFSKLGSLLVADWSV